MKLSTILKLVAACFVVGLVMSLLDLSPGEVYSAALDALGAAFDVVVDLFRSAFTGEVFSIFAAGASVILPVAALVLLTRWLRRRWR